MSQLDVGCSTSMVDEEGESLPVNPTPSEGSLGRKQKLSHGRSAWPKTSVAAQMAVACELQRLKPPKSGNNRRIRRPSSDQSANVVQSRR